MAQPAAEQDAPMLEINTTPLIDVLLVLLIMFILTIPLQSHAVKLDLPSDCSDCPDLNPLHNKVVVTRDHAILWNGEPVSKPVLARTLALTSRMTPEPELHLQPEPDARYELVDEVLAITKGHRSSAWVSSATRPTAPSEPLSGLEHRGGERH